MARKIEWHCDICGDRKDFNNIHAIVFVGGGNRFEMKKNDRHHDGRHLCDSCAMQITQQYQHNLDP